MIRPTIAVCGFGRCGSTMAMQMLIAGGVPPVPGAEGVPHEADASRLTAEQLAGRCVKILAFGDEFHPPTAAGTWRFVWLDRDPVEQAKSSLKLLVGLRQIRLTDVHPASVERLAAGYANDRAGFLAVLRRHGPVMVLEYERVLANPRRAARQLARLWPGRFNVGAAAAVVHRRDGRCLPDLAVEAAGARAAQAFREATRAR